VAKTKSDLIDLVAARTKMTRAHAESVVDQVFDCIAEALKRSEGIEVRGFGTFTLRSYREYDGRNPRTGVPVHVKAKRLAFFRVGKELRRRVDASRSTAAARQ
jgi:integration host factor subunit beta